MFVACLAKAQQAPTAADQQLLLLRNGQTLRGRITRDGDLYRVIVSNGEIRVKSAQVEFICRDLEDAYQQKRAIVQIGSLRDHLELAQWCQRHKLYDHAAFELDDAAAIAPNNPLVGLLRRRFETAEKPLPAPTNTQTDVQHSPSNEKLDRLVRQVPQLAMENFTHSIQPILINNCTLSGCHSLQSDSALRLERIGHDQSASRRLTQRNLYSVLQFVDRKKPLASKLLAVSASPHGASKTAAFSARQKSQYTRLVEWVLEVAQGPMPHRPSKMNYDGKPLATVYTPQSIASAPPILSQDVHEARPLLRKVQEKDFFDRYASYSWMDNPAVQASIETIPTNVEKTKAKPSETPLSNSAGK
ncbi:MAG: hypothetical protein ACWGMZ_07475 [Thermoguttaceae bacterium]